MGRKQLKYESEHHTVVVFGDSRALHSIDAASETVV